MIDITRTEDTPFEEARTPGGGGGGGGGGEEQLGPRVLRPFFQQHKAHKSNSITSITSHLNGMLYTSGRDGAVCMWRLERESDGACLARLVKEGAIQGWSGLELIAGIAWSPAEELLLLGFQHMHFVVWNVPQRSRILSFDCGGARRPYMFGFRGGGVFAAEPSCLSLAFVREQRLHVAFPVGAEADERRRTSGGGGVWFHGREVHEVLLLPGGGTDLHALTASEDGSVKLLQTCCSQLEGARGGRQTSLLCLKTLEGDRHEQLGAAMRCMSLLRTRRRETILVTGGAKDLLQVFQMKEEGGRTEFRMLSTQRLSSGKKCMLRFMSIETLDIPAQLQGTDDPLIVVAAASDDGNIR
eukprot:768596-Hanusia_phi.AAC.4